MRPSWLFADDLDDSAAGWGDPRVVVGDLVRSHAPSILVPLMPKHLDEVSGAPVAPFLSRRIVAEQLMKLKAFNHGIPSSITEISILHSKEAIIYLSVKPF